MPMPAIRNRSKRFRARGFVTFGCREFRCLERSCDGDEIDMRNLLAGTALFASIETRGWAVSDTYIIEVSSQAAGIVVRDPDGYRFFAASHRFNRLEGQLFRKPRDDGRAAIRVA